MSVPTPRSPAAASAPTSAAHRTLWRWHFYAGLFVTPFLIVLAITGTIYCFQPQIEPLLYPGLLRVTPQGEPLSPQTLLERARAAAPAGAVATTYTMRNDPRASAGIRVPPALGQQRKPLSEPVFRLGAGQPQRGGPLHEAGPPAASRLAGRKARRIADGTGRMLDAGDDRHRPGHVVAALARIGCEGVCNAAGKRQARAVEGNPSDARRFARHRRAGVRAVRSAVDRLLGQAVQGHHDRRESGAPRRCRSRAHARPDP
ncbi:hypothetical protein OJJOAM_000261 [Cupriavidus sp. H18C1]